MRDHDKAAKELAHRNAVAAYRHELDRQIKMFGEMADRGNGYAREYQDYLVALRDDTLSETEKRAGPGLIFNQAAADHAWRMLHMNVVSIASGDLKESIDKFSNWGVSGVSSGFRRDHLLLPVCLRRALKLFDPIESRSFVFRAAYPLFFLAEYRYRVRLVEDILKKVTAAWDALFAVVRSEVSGNMEYPNAEQTLNKLLDQLTEQCGYASDTYLAIDERKKLFETFKSQLEALSARVFACDSKRLAAGQDAPSKRSVTFEAKDTDLSTKGQCHFGQKTVTLSKDLKVSPRLLKNFIKKVDFEQQIIEFTNDAPLLQRHVMKIKKTGKNTLWKLLVRLLTQTEDDGWVTLSKQERNWHGLFRRTARGDKTRKIVDPTQDPVILGFHIFADKPAGDTGPTKIRLDAKCERGKYRSCVDKYNQWLKQKRTKAA